MSDVDDQSVDEEDHRGIAADARALSQQPPGEGRDKRRQDRSRGVRGPGQANRYTWPIAPEIDDAELERRVLIPADFNDAPTHTAADWVRLHEGLIRRHVHTNAAQEARRQKADTQPSQPGNKQS